MPSPAAAKATWSGIWNCSACVASMPATSAPVRMRSALELIRRGRFDHHESALVARRAARADRAFPEHRADVAAVGRRLETDPPGSAVPAPLLGHRGDRPGEMDRDSKHTGKDNACWYRFDSSHKAGPVFHWRDRAWIFLHRRTRICEQCGKRYELQRSSSRFCSPACKQQAYRKRLSVTPSVTPLATRDQHPRKSSATSGMLTLRGSSGRLGAIACARWHAPRRVLGADATA